MNILIIAGGTGGHVYPALSIAKEFKNQENSIIWIGQDGSLENRIYKLNDLSKLNLNYLIVAYK